MALQLEVPITCARPGTYLGGSITIWPRPGTNLHVRAFSISLVGVSKTRIVTTNGPSEELHESSATFLNLEMNMRRELMVLGSGYVEHFYVVFPEDPACAQQLSLGVEMPQLLIKPNPQTLPPSGEFGSGNVTAYSLEASLRDESSRDTTKATTMISFSKTRAVEAPDLKVITMIQEKTLASQGSVHGPSSISLALDSPQIIIQWRTFPLVLSLSQKTGALSTLNHQKSYLNPALYSFS